tara:strand:+ start:239 stop:541 length:303 start_codon:yes stop_codon:yes gene_type:complete
MDKYTILYDDDMCHHEDEKIVVFNSVEEANKDIEETIDSVKDAIKSGYMHKDSVHTYDDYEVVKIKFSDTDDQFVTYHLDGVQERVSSVSEWKRNLGMLN